MSQADAPAPVLVFGYGNPSRGDDALGPLFVERLEQALGGRNARVECLTDFQLQPEHALDMIGRELVVFVDASIACPAPWQKTVLAAARDDSYSSHALSPPALIGVFHDAVGPAAPPCELLAIRAAQFELGAPLGEAAAANLDAAIAAFLDELERRFPAAQARPRAA